MSNTIIPTSFVGVGQCGCNIAAKYASSYPKEVYKTETILMNTSEGDNPNWDAEIQFLFGSIGTGKSRELGIEMFKHLLRSDDEHKKDFVAKIGKILSNPLIFIPYSTGGGTGSGVGAALTNFLSDPKQCEKIAKDLQYEIIDRKEWILKRSVNSEDSKKKYIIKNPIVIPIVICPNSSEGETALYNTDEALSALSRNIDNGGRALFVFNGADIGTVLGTPKDLTRYYDGINSNICRLIFRFLNETNERKYKIEGGANLDIADKLNYLLLKGIMGFATIYPISKRRALQNGLPETIAIADLETLPVAHFDLIRRFYNKDEDNYRLDDGFIFSPVSNEHANLLRLVENYNFFKRDQIMLGEIIQDYRVVTPFHISDANTAQALVVEQTPSSSSSRHLLNNKLGMDIAATYDTTFSDVEDEGIPDMLGVFGMDNLSRVFDYYRGEIAHLKKVSVERNSNPHVRQLEEREKEKGMNFDLDSMI